MIIRRSRTLKFNLGNYEMAQVEAGIEVDSSEVADLKDVDVVLDNLLKNDVAYLASVSRQNRRETTLYDWRDSLEEGN